MQQPIKSYTRAVIATLLLSLLSLSSVLTQAVAAPAGSCGPTSSGPTSCGSSASSSPFVTSTAPASQGNQSGTQLGAGNPINVITGNKYQEEVDLPALPGPLGLEIVRHYNSSHHTTSSIGNSWRLSYDTELFIINNTLQIIEADGGRIIFARNPHNPSLCASQNPANGQIHITPSTRGDEYTWIWPNGRQLHFNHTGFLESIHTNTGEVLHLTRGLQGELLKVTDPQGRSLTMEYADKHSTGFKGIIAINSPVGRYTYQYDNTPKSPALANLVSVTYPKDNTTTPQITRHYHYGETAYIAKQASTATLPSNAPYLLTGITLETNTTVTNTTTSNAAANTPDKAKPQLQRINTWGYDALGRGILSVKGLPKQQDAQGHTLAGTGVEQVNLVFNDTDYKQPKTTILTNSLGQTTTYTHTQIAGENRLLSVIGAGCSSCGETNVRYGYDKLARLTDTTYLSTATPNTTVQALSTQRTRYDSQGRPLSISRISYTAGKAGAPQIVQRFEYDDTQTNTAQTNTEQTNTAQLHTQPSLIARPSVVAGKEHQTHIRYNAYGQPTEITETGYAPALPNTADNTTTNNPSTTASTTTSTPISRSVHYSYQRINGKSLLTQVDGPLPNGHTNSPQDSDITQYQYDKQGRYLVKVTAPNNMVTQLQYDATGRVVGSIASNNIATEYTYANVGKNAGKILSTQRRPATISLTEAKDAGLLQKTAMQYDVFGHTTMIQRADGQAVYMQYGADGKIAILRDALGNRVEWKDWNKVKNDSERTITAQQWFTADAPDTVARAWYFWYDQQQRLTQRLSPDGGLDTWRYGDSNDGGLDTSVQAQTASDSHWVQHIDPLNRMTFNAVNHYVAAQIHMTPAGYIDANVKLQSNLNNIKKTADLSAPPQATQIVDDFGRAIQFSSPQHGAYIAQYDAANHIAHISQPDGTQIDYTYDVAGQLLSKTAIDSSKNKDTIHYTYNAFGLQKIQDAHQTISFTQDGLGREIDKATTLVLQDQQAKTYHIHTRYDASGRVYAKQLIDGQWLVFGLNDKTGLTQAMTLHKPIWPSLTNALASWLNMPDLPLQFSTVETVVTDITVHPFNGITHLTHGNGISDDYGFDLAGRLVTVSNGIQTQSKVNASPFIKANYTYDAGRRLESETFTDDLNRSNSNQYAYRGWSQLATPPQAGFMKAVATNISTETNNISNATGTDDSKVSAQTLSESATKLDVAGRTILDANYRYHYNAWGKLDQVASKATQATIANYQVNALGERMMANYPSGNGQSKARYYLYDKQQRIAELDESGNVLQQYLYINQTPIAVINTPLDASAEIISIHADRRNAPVAATNQKGKVIWQTQYDAWGKLVKTNNKLGLAEQSSVFNFNLRLPGQWQDEATGLHYNYQRDYNPNTGRYLTPDPLGFPDGADPYAYVNNDPLNKIDPLGLYQSDIHYYMTFFLAVAAGVQVDEARVIALATQYIDDNQDTKPLNLTSPGHLERLQSYHFTQAGYDPEINVYHPSPEERATAINAGYPDPGSTTYEDDQIYAERRVKNPNNPQLNRLISASSNAPTRCAKLQFFGEYLHAFEDTFAHRDSNNAPIDINSGLGHLFYGSNPDYTYNHLSAILIPGHMNWNNNAAKTLEMEKEVFTKMHQFAKGKDVISAGKISEETFYKLLSEFNAIKEHEGDGYEKSPPSGKKIEKLQEELNKLFGEGVVNIKDLNSAAYSETQAANNRTSFLCDNGKPLDQKVYEGTILPTKCN